MTALSFGYLGLLLLDAVLSLADSATTAELHLSKWSTIALCLASLFVFIAAAVMSLFVRFRPRWPVLVSSGAYTLYFGTTLARAVMGVLPELGPAEQRVRNLEVATIELLLALVCAAGLLRGPRMSVRGDSATPTAEAS